MDAIEKIRQEIERRMNICYGVSKRETESQISDYYKGKAVALEELLSFLDTIEEEPEVVNELTEKPKLPVEWEKFLRDSTVEVFCAMLTSGVQDSWRVMARNAIEATDEIIRQLWEGRK